MPKIITGPRCQWETRAGKRCGRATEQARFFMDGEKEWFLVNVCKYHAHTVDKVRNRFTAPWAKPVGNSQPKKISKVVSTNTHPAEAGEHSGRPFQPGAVTGNQTLKDSPLVPAKQNPGEGERSPKGSSAALCDSRH